MARISWDREHTIVALNLYYRIPFGSYHINNDEVLNVAALLGRSPSSISMKLGNFASLDNELKERGIAGLVNTSKLDVLIWDEFSKNLENLSFESQAIIAKITNRNIDEFVETEEIDFLEGKEKLALIKQRINQNFFRDNILSSYDGKCCITDLDIPEMLVASHIVPWSIDTKNRLNPKNGLCLNVFHDKAFDKGFISFTDDYELIISPTIQQNISNQMMISFFQKYENKSIRMPNRHKPSIEFIKYHRENIFRN